MAKLFPPIVNNTTAIFYNQNGIVNITIPFLMNKATSPSNVSNMTVKIKTLQSSSYFYSFEDYKDIDEISYVLSGDSSSLLLIIKNEEIINKFKLGQFYKFQIAYINNNDIGYYSDVIIGKFTGQPSVIIQDLENSNINNHIYNYFGSYTNVDITENVYSYYFNLYNENDELVFTTGELIHDSSTDETISESIDQCYIGMDFNKQIYYLEYGVTTINGLKLCTNRYALQTGISVYMDIEYPVLEARIDNEEACIIVEFKSNSSQAPINCNFVIQRASEKDGYSKWEDCYRFSIHGNNINTIWKDYILESGTEYQYSISQYNDDGIYSEKVISNKVKIYFEDSFLYDGERQLKIKFNPKVSSFKIKNLENKIETLGSQHPFIVKNGKVAYKEFPISGLISFLMDSNFSFKNFNAPDLFRHCTSTAATEFKEIKVNSESDYKNNEFYIKNENLYEYILCDKKYEEIKDIPLYRKEYVQAINISKEDYEKNDYYLLDNTQFFIQDKYILCKKPYEEIESLNLYKILYSEDSSIKKFEYEKNKYYIRKKNPMYILSGKSYEEILDKKIILFKRIKETPQIDKLTDLVDNNIYKEQQFKIEVLNWLTDGKPKLFKSPTEGNYLVRLLNVSLTPNDTLGRMLHTFSCTAYEIAECTYENINNLKILKINNTIEKINNYWKSIKLNDIPLQTNILQVSEADSLDLRDGEPGTQFEIIFKNGDKQIIQIGVTGVYQLDYEIPFISLKLLNKKSNGVLTYSFKEKQVNDFISYEDSEIINVICRQFIGEHNDIVKILTYLENPQSKLIKNDKIEIYKILKIKILKRDVEELIEKIDEEGIIQYYNKYTNDLIDLNLLNKLFLYRIYKMDGTIKYKDFITGKEYLDYSPVVTFKDIKINVDKTGCFEWETYDEENLLEGLENNFNVENGAVLELSYSLRSSTFKIEDLEAYSVLAKKNLYKKAISDLESMYSELSSKTELNKEERLEFQSKVKSQNELIEKLYKDYINTLREERANQDYINGKLPEDQ